MTSPQEYTLVLLYQLSELRKGGQASSEDLFPLGYGDSQLLRIIAY